ncbi:MAG TPA: CPBP family intramembrane glutamic endopeptidase [Candidatus Dormibacteraeota bacterium]|nr:CPBP family intramembrane glutamic endopeptidase [Candidatus Dormibacteraeota bacterium]
MDINALLTYGFLAVVALVAQAAERSGTEPRRDPAAPRGMITTLDVARVLVVFVVIYAMLLGLTEIADRHGGGSVVDGALQLVAGGIAVLLILTGWDRIPGLRGLRPRAPISWLALSLYLLALAHNLAPTSGSTSVADTVSKPQTTSDLVFGQIPFVMLAIASVGPGVRRNARQTLERLGLLPLRPQWWLLGIVVGIVVVKGGSHVYDLVNSLTPADCQAQQEKVFQHLAGPARHWYAQLAIGVAAGTGEELLFRGALQPRVGILLASLLWASFHLQYTCHGLPSASNLYILLLGLVFGALRKWFGLGSAMAAHIAYDSTILLGF